MKLLISQMQRKFESIALGGGQKKIDKQHKLGKLTARERVEKLLDPDTLSTEIGAFTGLTLRLLPRTGDKTFTMVSTIKALVIE